MGTVLGALAGAALLLLASPVPAGEVCEPGGGRVSLMILKGSRQVHELAGAVARGVPVVARDASTVVFRDGRVITADVEAAGQTLNTLGWGARPIDVVATFGGRRARPASRRG